MSDTTGTQAGEGSTLPADQTARRGLRAVPSGSFLSTGSTASGHAQVVSFNKDELREILNLYGRKVAEGEWRDYAIDFGPQRAVFSIFRRSSEMPLYRVEKDPKAARRQGAYSVVAATGLILKRGHDLARVIAVLDKRVKLVVG